MLRKGIKYSTDFVCWQNAAGIDREQQRRCQPHQGEKSSAQLCHPGGSTSENPKAVCCLTLRPREQLITRASRARV